MRSLRSLAFLSPPKAILVPGMYFLGFSRYSNYKALVPDIARGGTSMYRKSYESLLVPLNTLLLVCVGVSEARDLAGVASEKTVKVRTDLVALALLQVVALLAAGLEHVRLVF